MTPIDALLDLNDPRLDLLRGGETADPAQCVLLWISRSQRAFGNHAVNAAIEIANRLDAPVVAAFCLTGYPRATLRAYTFMIEGLADLEKGLSARKIGWVLRTDSPAEAIPALASELDAAAIVCDQAPDRTGRGWRAAVAERATIPVVAVDADVVVPSALFPKEEWAPRTIRPKIARVLDGFLEPIPDPVPHRHSCRHESGDPAGTLDDLRLDRSVGSSPRFRGGQTEARVRLDRFVNERVQGYDVDRNRSDLDRTSELSPYLHFGNVSPIEVALAARDSDAPRAAIDSFIDELVVQRELTINFALRNPNYDNVDGIPDWGRRTLAGHAGDPRPVIYTRAELEEARTADPLWNACQRQMSAEGYLPNRLRMYWAKQLPLWTRSAEEAFEIAVALNDRYFVDGRDPNGYAGIAWSIGGRHDRPFPPERAITGLVRRMSAKGLKKHFDPENYIAQWSDTGAAPRFSNNGRQPSLF